jgi:hypothetical protein
LLSFAVWISVATIAQEVSSDSGALGAAVWSTKPPPGFPDDLAGAKARAQAVMTRPVIDL